MGDEPDRSSCCPVSRRPGDRELKLEVFVHNRKYGYGANQKTYYREALRAGADIVVMSIPITSTTPRCCPKSSNRSRKAARTVFGSRLLGGDVLRQGMPWWKFLGNRFLTALENYLFGLNLAEYHTGYRAYRREALEAVNLDMNSDKIRLRPGDRRAIRRPPESKLPRSRSPPAISPKPPRVRSRPVAATASPS